MKSNWQRFVLELIQITKKTRPDLVKDDTTLLLTTDNDEYVERLLVQYRIVGKELGYTLSPKAAKEQLLQEQKKGRLIFGIVNSTKDGKITPWHAVRING